jgi:2'-5' RNA ligase
MGELFETSLILRVSPELHDSIEEIRAKLAISASMPQTRPHLTLLFVGILERAVLDRIEHELRAPPFASLEVRLRGLDSFSRSGVLENIHIRVERSPEIVAFHDWALSVCRRAGWAPPSDISGPNYLPHVTIFGNIAVPPYTMEKINLPVIPTSTRLHDLRLRAHPWPHGLQPGCAKN